MLIEQSTLKNVFHIYSIELVSHFLIQYGTFKLILDTSTRISQALIYRQGEMRHKNSLNLIS